MKFVNGNDSAGRRIEKAYDGQTVMKYLYDGGHIIAEYDGSGSLLHKYIYGPGVDQPICMIDVEHSSAAYYYHFDGLGSVVALTNSSGSVVNLYEYSVYGEVSASDPNHPNRFLFTGREFDADTGLYYYRARYYNPYIGRFLQTDPAGQGINAYSYCRNSPMNWSDPSGMIWRPTGWVLIQPNSSHPWMTGQISIFDIPERILQRLSGEKEGPLGYLVWVGELIADLTDSQFGGTFNVINELWGLTSLAMAPTWSAYFEVGDYNDWNGDGIIDWKDLAARGWLFDENENGVIDGGDLMEGDIEKLIEQWKWIEVTGVLSVERDKAGSDYLEGSGYFDPEGAFSGATTAAAFYYEGPQRIDEKYLKKAAGDGWGKEWTSVSQYLNNALVWNIINWNNGLDYMTGFGWPPADQFGGVARTQRR